MNGRGQGPAGRPSLRAWPAAVLVASVALAALLVAASAAQASTKWLCGPGVANDPCRAPLTATVTTRDGRSRVVHAVPAAHAPIDCFYVYPTVSRQPTPIADLSVDPEERAVAIQQASRFSQVCRVFAPVYRQLTVAGIAGGTGPPSPGDSRGVVPYLDVLAAWRDYLHRFNHGRGVVLIGHSQGSFLLRALIRLAIDPRPADRRRLVSALLLGGNVEVRKGAEAGGDFRHVPACRSAGQVGCVVAYSMFAGTPPANSRFGRTPAATRARNDVLCTNPASLGGGSGLLEPYVAVVGASSSSVRWASSRGLYRARCLHRGGATWLQVTATAAARRLGKTLPRPQGPDWGLHVLDVNYALGNLVGLVRHEAAAYVRRHGR